MAKMLELRAENRGIGDRGVGSDVERPQVVPGQRRPNSAALRASKADGDAWCRKELPPAIGDAGRRIEHLLQHGAGERLPRVDAEFAEDAAHGLRLSKRNARGFPENRADSRPARLRVGPSMGRKENFLAQPWPRCAERFRYLGSSRTFGPVKAIGAPFASEPLQSLRAVCSMLFVLHQRVWGVTVCEPPGWMTIPRSVASPDLAPSKKFTRLLIVIVVPPVLRRTCVYCQVWGSEHPCAGGSL